MSDLTQSLPALTLTPYVWRGGPLSVNNGEGDVATIDNGAWVYVVGHESNNAVQVVFEELPIVCVIPDTMAIYIVDEADTMVSRMTADSADQGEGELTPEFILGILRHEQAHDVFVQLGQERLPELQAAIKPLVGPLLDAFGVKPEMKPMIEAMLAGALG